MLKLHCCDCSSEVKDTIYIGVYIVELSLDCWLCPDPIRDLSSKILVLMAQSQAPYIHVILADIVSIT